MESTFLSNSLIGVTLLRIDMTKISKTKSGFYQYHPPVTEAPLRLRALGIRAFYEVQYNGGDPQMTIICSVADP
jgi:hypothetical protein